MNNDMLIAGAIGFAPAMILMFWTLRDYTYPKVEKPFFEDKKAFGLFAVGMVLGVAIYAAQSWFPLQVVYVALAFALVEELVKLMILNFPKFQRKLDTSFYGLAIGLGIGSTMGFGADAGRGRDPGPAAGAGAAAISTAFPPVPSTRSACRHGGTEAKDSRRPEGQRTSTSHRSSPGRRPNVRTRSLWER